VKLAALLLVLAPILPAAHRPTGWMRFEATAYSTEGETASGKVTREGRTVAADPAMIPLGSRIEVREAGAYSGTYTVQDTGRRLAGRHIDFFIADRAEAKQFGKKPVRVRILQRGSAENK